jgi:hypothetical protein
VRHDVAPAPGAVDLYWIPLGAGGHVVRLNGRIYEAIKAFIEHRRRLFGQKIMTDRELAPQLP